MNFWKIEADPILRDQYEFHSEADLLPGIKCSVCRRTWGVYGRSAITDLNKAIVSSIKKFKGPCSVDQWKALKSSLTKFLAVNRQNDAIEPAMQVGRSKLKRYKNCNFDFLWTGGGNCFVIDEIAKILRLVLHPMVLIEPCVPADKGFNEIIPVQVKFQEYGELLVCDVCGFTNRDNVEVIQALGEFQSSSGVTSAIYQVPGAKVVDETLMKKIQHLRCTNIVFTPYDCAEGERVIR